MRSGGIIAPHTFIGGVQNLNFLKLYGFLPMPTPIPVLLPFEVTLQFVLFACFVLFALLLGYSLERHMKKKWQKSSIINLYLTVIAASVIFWRYGIVMTGIKGLILFLILLYASNSDLRTREVSDVAPLMIAITALIGITTSNIPWMILGAVCITVPQVIIATLKPNCYGGADIKIMAACSFLLGFGKGVFALILGLMLAIICTVVISKIKHMNVNESFAFVPYLAVGSFIAFLL